MPVTLGSTRLIASGRLKGLRVGVVANPASVDHAFGHVVDRVRAAEGVTIYNAAYPPGHEKQAYAHTRLATIALAEQLTAQGARMYTAYWCPHCHEQKELFGKEAAEKLTVIECAPDGRNSQKELCDAKKIEGYPTWEINGQLDSGVKPLLKLAELIGYKGPALN